MADSKKTYKQLDTELQEILSRVEEGEYENLDDMLADHESAAKLIKEMQKQLKSAENSIKTVKK